LKEVKGHEQQRYPCGVAEQSPRQEESPGVVFPPASGRTLNADKNRIIYRALGENRSCLMEHECKELLERMGIKTTGSFIALTAEDAVEIGRSIGYPVALKIVSRTSSTRPTAAV
jgi:acyl-CoA synthetase (NDP forming)